jgi:predicted ATPase
MDQGIALIRDGLDLWEQTGAQLFLTYLLSLLADAYRRAGRLADALEVINSALRQSARTEEKFWEAELQRLRAEVLIAEQPLEKESAETVFRLAMESARTRGQRSIELRAATNLAQLWHSRHRTDQARAILEPIYSWFTEGFDTNDLKVAHDTLVALKLELDGAA